MGRAWLAVLMAGCAPALELELAAVEGAQAAVLVAHHGEEITWASVLEPAGEPFELPVRYDRLSLVYAPAGIDALGLRAGELDLGAGRASLRRYGFDAQRVWRDGTWSSSTALDATLGDALLLPARAESTDCAPPVIREVPIAARSRSIHPVAYRDAVVLVGGAGEAFRVDADLTVTPLVVEGGWYLSGGAVVVDGTLWAGTARCIVAFDLHDDVLVPRPSSEVCARFPIEPTWIHSRDGVRFLFYDGFGHYVMTRSALEYVGGHDVSTMDGDGVIWTAADATIDHLGLTGERRSETVPIVGSEISSLAWSAELGLMLGDSSGMVLRRTDGRWEMIGDPGFFYGAWRFAPWPRGFVVAGGTAEAARYIEGRGFCPLGAVGRTGTMVRLGTGLLMAGGRHPLSQELSATWFDYGP